jgi:WD40 repeat protein
MLLVQIHSNFELIALTLSIYEFPTVNIHQPIKSYTSKLFDNSSFYTKIDLSPCGRFLASGSCNQMLYIWETKDKGKRNIQTRPLVYEGHAKEVSSVRWSRSGQQVSYNMILLIIRL